MNFKINQGFSFVELSIVIIIFTSLFALIFSSKSISEQAKKRNIINNLYNYEIIINQFYHKFTKYPGDFNQAYNFFGNNCAINPAYCNGDGDGIIEAVAANNNERENLRLWQHLNLAEMLPGNFPGTGASANLTNSPLSNLDNAIYHVENTNIFNNNNNKLLLSSVFSQTAFNGIISVLMAKSIDIKIDDGRAHKGKLYSITGDNIANSNDCSNYRSSSTPIDYNLSSTEEEVCFIGYLFDKD